MATRGQRLADAFFAVAGVNHYMVGIVEPFTDEELTEAEQILIAGENESARGNSHIKEQYTLALDLVEQEQRKRASAASRVRA